MEVRMIRVIVILVLCGVVFSESLKKDAGSSHRSGLGQNISVTFLDENNQQIDTKNPPTHANPTRPRNQNILQTSSFDLSPLFISQKQAPRSASYRNKISEDSVKANAIFNRQINANKAIANLLDIVQQLTANVHYAKNQIPEYQNQLKKSVALQRVAQTKILTAQNQKSRLTTAINNLNESINTLRKQLSDFESLVKQTKQAISLKKSNVLSINDLLQKNQNMRKDLIVQNRNIKEQIDILDSQYAEAEEQVKRRRLDIEDKKKQMSGIDGEIEGVVRNIKSIDGQIMDLKRRLDAAYNRKSHAEDKQKRLREKKLYVTNIQAQLQNELLKSTKKLSQVEGLRAKSVIQQTQLNVNLTKINQNTKNYVDKINQIKSEIQQDFSHLNQYEASILTKNRQMASAATSLQSLTNQMSSFQANLRNIYFQVADANAKVQTAKQNLDAYVRKWQKNSNQLASAISNLQKARAEKQLSDLAVQEILRQRTNVLPYAVLLKTQGPKQINNPNELARRVQLTGQVSKKEENLKQNYSNQKSSKMLFPLQIYKQIKGQQYKQGEKSENLVTFDSTGNLIYSGDFKCEEPSSEQFQANIRVLGINILTLQESTGRIVNAKIGSCSQIKAYNQNYTIQLGDRVQISGKAQDNSSFKIYSAIFKSVRN